MMKVKTATKSRWRKMRPKPSFGSEGNLLERAIMFVKQAL